MKLAKLDKQNKNELSMIEVAIAVLETKGDVMYFNDLLKEVADYLDLTDEQVEQNMAQFYTDINSRGSFISPIDGMWGLREWYPIDSINEELTYKNDEDNVHTKIANDGFDEIVDEEELIEEDVEEELPFEDDEEDEVENDELEEYEDDLEDLAIDDDEDDEEDDELEDLTIIDEEDLDD